METKKTYRVWIEQVNQTYVDVKASDDIEAAEKAVRKWKREYACATVADVKKIKD